MIMGVGQEKEPLPLVRRRDIGCSKQTPLRIEPEVGQRAEYVPQVPNKGRHVLHEEEGASHFAKDADDLEPERGAVAI